MEEHEHKHEHGHSHEHNHEHGEENLKDSLIKVIISGVLFALALLVKFDGYINNIILLVAYIIVGFKVLSEAFENILKGEVFDENFLMAVATLGAFGIGEFPEAVAVMLFYQVGELFQDYAVDKSRESISKLMDIRPDYANLYKDNQEEKVSPDKVNVGDIIIVKPGEKIPLDGKIVEGKTSLDTKALTGESVPEEVYEGMEVLSGSININGLIKIEVTKEFGESTVSKILELVEHASDKKAKSENFITKFARYYTPAVVIIALLLGLLPPLLIEGALFSDWIYRALSFLVISCPCALVISIPLSFFGGIGGASRAGILIKGSSYLENLSNVKTIMFDKTGTLTKGVFEVQKILPVGIEENELLEIAAYAEHYSNHPISKSIKTAYGKEIDENRIKNIEEVSGHGIFAKIDDKEVLAGNQKLMTSKNIDFAACQELGTAVYIAIDNKFAGTILIADSVKDDSKKAIRELKKLGIKEAIMLTGDRRNVAESVGNELGLDKVYSELLPNNKVEVVEEYIKKETGKVAFAGDGINDSPVLALADIGIAMGGVGADSAIEAADIVIMTDEPSKIVSSIKISRKTMRIVRENIIFAILVKFIVLALSAFGISTMWEAVFADVGVSVIAVINALRALKVKNA